MPGGRPRKPAHLKQYRRKSSKGMACGGVGDEAELIADAIARKNKGQGRPLNTMLLAGLVSLLLARKGQGQPMPSPNYLRKFQDDDIRQMFTPRAYRHSAAEDGDPEWQKAEQEMQAAGLLADEIQHVKDEWAISTSKLGVLPHPATIARYLTAAIDIVHEF
jgi:hypothetical protein